MSGVEAVVGVAAAGVGFASLAIQLLDSIQKLKVFHGRVKNAPTTLGDLIFDLETMGQQLDLLERHKSHDTAEAGLLARCIDRCRMMTDRIQGIVTKMQRIGDKNAQLVKFYTAFKDPDIAKLITELEQAKASLQSSMLTFYFERQSRLHYDQLAVMQQQNIQLALIWTHTQNNSAAIVKPTDQPDDTSLVPTAQNGHALHLWHQSQPSHQRPLASKQPKRFSKRSNKKPAWSLTIQLPKQLCSQIWKISFMQASSGWDLNLRTYVARAPSSEIFYRCITGDTRGVQRMIAEGAASLWDVTPGHMRIEPNSYLVDEREFTLLWMAACSGHVNVFQWLVQQRRHSHEISLADFLGVYSWVPPRNTEMLDLVLRTCLENEAIVMDLDLTVPSARGFLSRMGESHLETISDSGVLLESDHSTLDIIEDLFRNNNFITARTFLKLIGLESTSPQLATLTTGRERFSTLHFVAQMLAAAPNRFSITDPAITDWLSIAHTVLKNGFDPCSLALRGFDVEGGRTPLWCLVNGRHYALRGDKWILDAAYAWVRTIQVAGLDLLEYGRRESEIWKALQDDIFDNEEGELTLNYSPIADHWKFKKLVSTMIMVPLYQMERVPGSFDSTPYIPKYICWVPERNDKVEYSWRFVTEAKTWRHYRDAFEDNNVGDNVGDQGDMDDTLTKAYFPPDDASLTVLLANRRVKWADRPRRSNSVPPRQRHRNKKGYPRSLHTGFWDTDIHHCTFTLSYEYYGTDCERTCANGTCNENVPASPVHACFAWQDQSFLADIRDCQDGCLRRSSLSLHTGTKDCPQRCAKVHLEQLNVPEDCRMFHPLRHKSEQWDDP